MENHTTDRRIGLFFILTIVYSWLVWLPSVIDGFLDFLPFDVSTFNLAVVVIGGFGPMLAACALVYQQERWRRGESASSPGD